ncbi:MAG: SRPBCC family protein [Sporocytophaga sp.]|uniref:SRPBCC family protein n=1 Tax=Sporocytophaga sp. TaxID=2231183 RepID=UPI001B0CF021|nr:SRPBCC family protein [Sporocytophaga sp.]MBO9703803.1 SRPBCC family protein [Sporocytophaga sp.]
MKIYTLNRVQILPVSMEKAWNFFTSPHNLSKITPSSLNFKVLSKNEGPIHPGMIIRYKVNPISGIPLNWVTEITHVENLQLFVDEQRFGPYAFWHHLHKFKEVKEGVEMEDLVHYALPLGPIGSLIHALIVRKKVNEIFDFRTKVLKEIFGDS